MKTTIVAMLALGCMLDLLIWKRRKYAKGLIYYEIVYLIVNSCVPFNYGEIMSIFRIFSFCLLHLGYSCNMT